jgi:hypothetical protein
LICESHGAPRIFRNEYRRPAYVISSVGPGRRNAAGRCRRESQLLRRGALKNRLPRVDRHVCKGGLIRFVRQGRPRQCCSISPDAIGRSRPGTDIRAGAGLAASMSGEPFEHHASSQPMRVGEHTPDAHLSVTQTGSVSEALLIILLTMLSTPPLLFRYAVRLVRPPGRSALASRQCRITRASLDGHTELVDFRMGIERARPEDKQDRADDQNAHVRLPPHGQGSYPNLSPALR